MYLLKHLNLNAITKANSVLKIEALLPINFDRNKQNQMPEQKHASPASMTKSHSHGHTGLSYMRTQGSVL